MGGVAFRAPVLATLFLIVALATLAMPGSANFAGEFLILIGVFNAKLVFALIASDRRRDGLGLHAARVHPHDAQPGQAGRRVLRPRPARRGRARAARALHPRVRASIRSRRWSTPRPPSTRSSGPRPRRSSRRRRHDPARRRDRAEDRLDGDLAARRPRRRRVRRPHDRAAARAVRAPRDRAVPRARHARRDGRPVDRDVGRQRQRDRRRDGDGRPDAVPHADLRRRRRGRRAALVAGGGAARGRPRGVLRAAADGRARHDRARGRDEPRHRLHRLRAALDPALRAVRDGDAARDVARVRA